MRIDVHGIIKIVLGLIFASLVSFSFSAHAARGGKNPEQGYLSVYGNLTGHPGPNNGLCNAIGVIGTTIYEAGNPIPALVPASETCECMSLGRELPWFIVAELDPGGTTEDTCFIEE